jgi:DNA-binding LacI/PurR family transcriptional regulator
MGATVSAAAEAAGVSRETVHRWLRNDWQFRASLNRARRELQESVNARLLACSHKAADNIAQAIESGDVRLSLVILRGLGALSGNPPTLGTDDPDLLRDEEETARAEGAQLRMLRRALAS